MNNPYLRVLSRLLAYAGLWAVGGYMAGAALETIGLTNYSWSIILAALNLICGLVLFKIITDNPTFERLFFEGKIRGMSHDHPAYRVIGALWSLPLMLLVVGAMLWFWAIILSFFMPE